MRLLNTTTGHIHSFLSAPTVPYAILSHTWGPEEVTLQDMLHIDLRSGLPDYEQIVKQRVLLGYEKIVKSCEIARRDEYEYIWIDTCCIDKTNSAELSEALNSMFRWYQDAAVCYAYLEDVETGDELGEWSSQFRGSRWFTRGWTLQELLAPKRLVFYSESWEPLGTKIELCDILSEITRVGKEILEGGELSRVCVGKKMSWVSSRQTTRPEDIAYCLLGIFDINMPLLYGEGEKAFLRLQEEILKNLDDDSIFAWQCPKEISISKPFHGLLATSPAWFADAHRLEHPDVLSRLKHTPGSITSKGLRTELLLFPVHANGQFGTYYAILNCREETEDLSPVIVLQKVSDIGAQFARVRPNRLWFHDGANLKDEHFLLPYAEETFGQAKMREVFVHQNPRVSLPVSAFYYPGGGSKVNLESGLEVLCTDTYPRSQKYGFKYQDGANVEVPPTQNLRGGYVIKASHNDIAKLMNTDQLLERQWFPVGALRLEITKGWKYDNDLKVTRIADQVDLIVGFERSSGRFPATTVTPLAIDDPGEVGQLGPCKPWYRFMRIVGREKLEESFFKCNPENQNTKWFPECITGVSFECTQIRATVAYRVEITGDVKATKIPSSTNSPKRLSLASKLLRKPALQ